MGEVLIPSPRLSPRELQVVQHLANGLQVQEAAAQMGIAASTADIHVAHAKAKKGTTTIGGLVAAAMRAGEVQ